MCFYATTFYKPHYVCVPCRVSAKRWVGASGVTLCPRCAEPMACVGRDFAAPRRVDRRAWSVVAAVVAAGLRYDGRTPCGCAKEPKYRPRTRAELRARRQLAAREGIPLPDALSRRDS